MVTSSDFTKLLNPLYGYDAVQDQMRASFARSKPSVLVLNDFLVTRQYKELAAAFALLQGSAIFEPDRCSYTDLTLPLISRGTFVSLAFFDFVRNATGLKVKDVRLSGQRFGHRDFTLLHDDQPAAERFVFLFMLAPRWDVSWGGSMIFSFGDERPPLVFEPRGNALVLLNVPPGMREFVKYVNHHAKNTSLTYLVGEFLIR